MRTVDEWIGPTDDAKIPPRVRVRVFERHHGRCGLTNRLIRAGEKWECHHIVALSLGGSHRESNLCPVLVDAHKQQTRRDVKVKAKIARVRKRHLGIKPVRKITRWRKFSGEVVIAPRER